jgi:predicted GNAT superfamily acetyltransferase
LSDRDRARGHTPPAATYTIRPVTDPVTLRRCEAVQALVWGMAPSEIVPLYHFVASLSAGGSVLGAFTTDEELVGFVYAFPGWRPEGPVWYSHMAGVLPAHQGTGLGLRLKCAQRDAALTAGIDRVVWTYDPLQSRNARFNFDRLGVVASRYYVDYYGPMTDAINRGLPSDRFEVDWCLRSPRVVARLSGEPAPPAGTEFAWALSAARAADGAPPGPLSPPAAPDLAVSGPRLLVEIPADLARLKADRPEAALQWREATREAFLHYFPRGYEATAVVRPGGAGSSRVAYVLEQKGALP